MTVIEVAIGPGGAPGRFRVEVLASPVGEASATVELDADALLARRGLLQQAVLASAVPSRRVLPETEQPVREAGELLFAGLLGTGEVAGRYRAAAAVAAERGEGLRVVLRIGTPALAGLPWEAMFDQAAGAYVCRQDQLVRHVPVASVPAPLRVRPPLRILGVVSSPRGLPPLDVDKEQDQLARALARPVGQGLAELHWAPSATWADLQDLLLDGEWHVLHFIGHGDFDPGRDEGVLALVREDERADLVGAHRLADLLRQARPMPRLVVLNSCSGAAAGASDLFSGTAAALVRAGVSAVAAMQYEISDSAAVAFARGFYAAIARGRGVDDAVSSGRVAILGTGDRTLEWVTPVLYLRGHDSRLFTVQAPPPEQLVEPGECSGSVTAPKAGSTVGKEIQVEGVVRNLPERHHIWIALQDRRGLFWAKGFEVTPDHDGRFKRLVYEGGELRSFTLLLLLASEAGHRQLNGWIAECSRAQSWPGIPPAPDRFHVLDSVTLQFDPAPTGQSGGPPI